MTQHLRIPLVFLFLLAVAAAAPKSAPKKKDDRPLKDQLPRIKAVEPADALKTFTVQKGFRLEMVAAEPLVSDPVDACFDENGRMYVAEMHGYPFSHEPTRLNPKGGGLKDAGIIRLLEDTNGDGRMDKSVKFATGINWPTSVCCYKGGVFVLAPPHIHYFKDTDGDGKADVSRIVYSGFRRDNVQAIANNMKWTPDNRIALAAGRNGGNITRGGKGKPVLRLGRIDMQFDPATLAVEPLTGGIQFGHSLDDWGNRFVCSNSNHIQQVVFPYRYVKRNPTLSVSGAIRGIAKGGPAAPVYRKSPAEPWRVVRTRRRVSDPKMRARLSRTEQFAIGFFTSATGVTIYRGAAYPEEFRGNAFIGDVGGNLVHRKTMTPAGVTYSAARADFDVEFIASTDNWFRPVNFVNAPDGTLYVLDMYRETIEHPYSIPEDIKRYLDLQSGLDRGRIYRIVGPGGKRLKVPKLGKATAGELVAALESPNGWTRETAQRLLVERQDQSAVPLLRKRVTESKSPLARMHALYTLAGLNALKPELLMRAVADTHPNVRRHAIRLAEPFLDSSQELFDAVAARTGDAEFGVRFQLAFSLGESKRRQAVAALGRILQSKDVNRDLQTAVMSSVGTRAEQLAQSLLSEKEYLTSAAGRNMFATLTQSIAASRDAAPAARLLAATFSAERGPEIERLVLESLGDGLQQRGSSLEKLTNSPKVAAPLRKQIAARFETAAALAANDSAKMSDRRAAVRLLAHAGFAFAERTLSDLLEPQHPQVLQQTAIEALAVHRSPRVAGILIGRWRGFSPAVRKSVIDALAARRDRIAELFKAVESGKIRRADVPLATRQQLRNHPIRPVRAAAGKLFADDVTTNRSKVVASYRGALELEGNAARGLKFFTKKCSQCHRIGTTGHAVGPDLASVRNKSPGDLLVSILDPNREAQPNFTSYSVVTDSGKIHTGIIAAETAGTLTLRRAEAKQDVILRSSIESLVSSGKSLMPEGLEKDVNRQQMADLIALIKTLKPPAKAKKSR